MQQRLLLPSLISQLQSSFLVLVTFAYLLGQACAGSGWSVATPWWIALPLLLGSLSWFFSSRSVALLVLSTFCIFQGGVITLQKTLTPDLPAHHLQYFDLSQAITIEGWLFREPDRFPHRGRLYFEAIKAWQTGTFQPATGKVLLSVRSLKRSWQYGDLIRLTVKLRPPRNFHTPGSFNYESYLARQGIYLTAFLWDDSSIEHTGWQGNRLREFSERLRRKIGAFFSSHLTGQTSAVLRALIIGDKGGLTKDTRTAFARAGVAHVLSISGLHISLVATASYGLWWWLLGRSHYVLLRFLMPKIAALLTLLPVIFYAGLSGGNIATWRSVIMVATYLFAILCNRQEEIYRSLALAALLISVLWPGSVLDISFQLSFLSVLSIVIGMNRFSIWWNQKSAHLHGHRHRQQRLCFWLLSSLIVSFCALISTAPLTAFYFNQISVTGGIANLLIVPLLGSGAVLFGLVAAVMIFLSSTLASVFLFSAGLITQVGLWITQTISEWPWAALSVVTPTLFELLCLYGLLGALLCYFSSAPPAIASTGKFLVPVFTLALLLDSCFWLSSRYFHHELRVTFLDVGQGDAAVIEFPGSQVMVIDGGGFASEEFDSGEAIIAPFLWSRKIKRVDFLVMSHPQLDHYGGLVFLVEHFAPRELWFNGEQSAAQRFTRFWTALQQNKVTLKHLCDATPPFILATVQVEVLHPPCESTNLDTNNSSLVLRLSHGAIDFLFPGDLEAEGEQFLLAHHSSLASEILKAPHHGSRTSSTQVFVNTVAPQLVAASLGYLNRFRFPAQEVVQRYEALNARFLRTDRDGAIFIESDGQTYNIEISHQIPASP